MNMTAQVESRKWERVCASLASALNRGELDVAAACFARHACLITQDATAIQGREHIRPVLEQLIARRTAIEIERTSVLLAGDIALARERWTISSDGVLGSRFEQTTDPTLVLQRVDADWKIAIAAPWDRESAFQA